MRVHPLVSTYYRNVHGITINRTRLEYDASHILPTFLHYRFRRLAEIIAITIN